MLGISKNTIENLCIILAGILLYAGLKYSPVIGTYITSQPLWVVAVAILLFAMAGKIADSIKFLDKQTVTSFVYLLGGTLLFFSGETLPQAISLFTQYPLIVIAIALGLLLGKDKIADLAGG